MYLQKCGSLKYESKWKENISVKVLILPETKTKNVIFHCNLIHRLKVKISGPD